MVDTGIFATTLNVQERAGANASTVSNTEAYINSYMTQAESQINVESEFNWSDDYTGLNVDVKGVLTLAASCLSAVDVINYDPSGFTGLTEATTIINTLLTKYDMAIKLLREKDKGAIFIQDA